MTRERWHIQRGNWFQLTRCGRSDCETTQQCSGLNLKDFVQFNLSFNAFFNFCNASTYDCLVTSEWFRGRATFYDQSRIDDATNFIFFSSNIYFSYNRPKSNDDEDFYFTDLDDEDEAIEMDATNTSPPLPPTLSHSDMARPPHEDPEYQRKIVGNIRQGLLMSSGGANGQTFVKATVPMTGSNTVIHNYATWSQTSPVRLKYEMKIKKKIYERSLSFRIHRKSTSDCRRDRPHLMHHIHRQRTPQPIIQFWFNNIIQCYHHKDQSRNYLTVLHRNCRRLHNRTRRCSTRPPNPSICRVTMPRCVR